MKQLIIILMMLVGISTTALAQSREHVVKIGEDFASIAQKYGVTEQELANANPKSKICYVGLKLIIPPSATQMVESQESEVASEKEQADKKADKKAKKNKKEKKEKVKKEKEKKDKSKDKKEKKDKKSDKKEKSKKDKKSKKSKDK